MIKEKKDTSKVWKKVLAVYIGIVLYLVLFFVIGGKDIYLKQVSNDSINQIDNFGELYDDMILRQSFSNDALIIESVNLDVGTYERENQGTLNVQITDGQNILGTVSADISSLKHGENSFPFGDPISVDPNETYYLEIFTSGAKKGNTVTLYYGNAADDINYLSVNNQKMDSMQLVYSMKYKKSDPLGNVLMIAAIAFILFLGLYIFHMWDYSKKGKRTVGMDILDSYHTYKFLLEQLVLREFKVRYKRSVLGILWSFMNPILVMIVQFFVFSLIFKSNIPHYIVYLLIGITFFNFFNESTNGGMLSIVQNASLIKKVYVPKYIYPLSIILSSMINFSIGLILLFAMTLIEGIPLNQYMLLIPYAIVCIIILSSGVAFILTTGMTFFRDVQFIYSVFLTMLTYMTPLFWDLAMIPSKYLWIFKCNPLCDIILFVRSVILYGVYPGTEIVILSVLIPVIILMLGIYIFRKNQDKFILYI